MVDDPKASQPSEVDPAEFELEGDGGLVEPELDEEQAEAEFVEAFIAAQFSGPLPPPDILRAYDEVVEGGAERIVGMWEGEVQHRRRLESQQVGAFISGTTRAQWMAFAIILVIGVGGLILAALGHSLVGLAGFIIALASVAASFFPRLRSKGPKSAAEGEG